MLIRAGVASAGAFVSICLIVGVAQATPPQPPNPPDPLPIVTGDNNGGTIGTTVIDPGAAPISTRPGTAATSDTGNRVTCTWTVEGDQASNPSLVQVYGGTWYDVSCSDGSRVPIGVFVPAGSSNVPSPVVQAGTLARTARNLLRLPKPQIRHNPMGDALVGLATWWWIEPGQWRPLRQRTQAGPVWAEVTATPVSTTWDAGDGSAPVVCPGPGTPYDTTQPEAGQLTDCSHTYRRTTADQPQTGPSVNDRFFTVTVTTSWQVTWIGSAGSGGTLPVLTTSSTFPLAVAQRETVVTGGSG
jgi:hypothetical protein